MAVCDDGGLKQVVAAIHAHGVTQPKVREWGGICLANLSSDPSADVRDALIEERARL